MAREVDSEVKVWRRDGTGDALALSLSEVAAIVPLWSCDMIRVVVVSLKSNVCYGSGQDPRFRVENILVGF